MKNYLMIKTGYIDKEYSYNLNKLILGMDSDIKLHWHYVDNVTRKSSEVGYPGFVHIAKDSKSETVLCPILTKILVGILQKENYARDEILGISVIRVNLLLPLRDIFDREDAIHTDKPENNWQTILYYVNDSDGPTKFYDNNKKLIHKVDPEQGKYIIFDSNTYHSASLPEKTKKRATISFVLRKKDG